MKIAVISPFEEPVPPKKYGGTELVVYNLVTELVRKGHNVTLFASGDARVPCEVFAVFPKAIRDIAPYDHDMKARDSAKYLGIVRILEALRKESFDIVHNHIGWRFCLFRPFFSYPMVTTLHGPMSLAYQHLAFTAWDDLSYVSISDNQRKPMPNLRYVATVYNGIDVGLFPFEERPGDYLFMLGRMSAEKGVKEAIEVTRKVGKKLIIASKVDVVDQPYYESVKPLIDGDQIQFIGEIGFEKKTELLQHAYALLAPIQWEEPFGLNVIEAMACGTPVLGMARGSFPEIIDHGKTGFLASSVDEMASHVNLVSSIDRRVCRKSVEQRFTKEVMASGYLKAYQQLLG